MRPLLVPALLYLTAAGVTLAQNDFQQALAAKVQQLEKANASAMLGRDGWLFLKSELRFLAQGKFWGDAAAKAARSRKSPDPLPAIVDFHEQLRARGIHLMVVPVPAKARVYSEKLDLGTAASGESGPAPQMQEFYQELRTRGVDVLDLGTMFLDKRNDTRGPVFCRTDSHWSGVGTVLAAQVIAAQVRLKMPSPQEGNPFSATWGEATITGDLVSLLPPGAPKPEPEKLAIRTVTREGGAAVQPDPNSPVLVLGDSHTLVFRDFLAQRAGLVDQLAHELGFAPDLIGTRGSGATAVRVSLYRKTRSDAGYLAKKKIVVWCFASREFTEADQGWVQQPVAK